MTSPFRAKIIGIPHIPSVTMVNVRAGAGTNSANLLQVPVGLADLPIVDVLIDNEARNLFGKTYQWFRCQFPSGLGWVRDDLIEIVGDGTDFGYPVLTTPQTAFNLTRQAVRTTSSSPIANPVASPTTTTTASPAPATTGTTNITSPALTATSFSAALTGSGMNNTVAPIVVTPSNLSVPTASSSSASVTATLGTPKVICMIKSGGNLRSSPSSTGGLVAKINYLEQAEILDSAAGIDGKDFLWIRVRYQGRDAWIREDLVRYTGSFGDIGLSHQDLYPSPAPQSHWIRDFDSTGNRIGVVHHGWDHAGEIGAPILASPKGGKVIDVRLCARCGAEGLSVEQKGFAVGDSRVLRDEGWNYGYGHFVIVRYTHDLLPESAKTELARRGFSGAHCFVMYAHLKDMLVKVGQDLSANQQIATLGNSGNSTGAHLHLELRAHRDANEVSWAKMIGGLMSPAVLFLR